MSIRAAGRGEAMPRPWCVDCYVANRGRGMASPLRWYGSGEWVSPICPGRVGVPDLFPICFFGVRVAARWVGVAGIGREGDPVGRPYAGRVSGIWGPRSFAAGWVSPVRRRVGVPSGCVPGGCPRFVLSREWVFPICFLGVRVAARWVGVPGIFGVRATQWVAPTDGVEPCKLMKWRTAPSPFG